MAVILCSALMVAAGRWVLLLMWLLAMLCAQGEGGRGSTAPFVGRNEEGDLVLNPAPSRGVLLNGTDAVAELRAVQQLLEAQGQQIALLQAQERMVATMQEDVCSLMRLVLGGADLAAEMQLIPTVGGADWEAFEVDGTPFLAVANSGEGVLHSVNSAIYRWSGSKFVHWQDIPTKGAVDWESFEINGIPYLAVANHFDDAKAEPKLANSVIYRWNGTAFEHFQDILTSGARDWAAFEISGTPHLVVANSYNDTVYDSVIYSWNGSTFVAAHWIPTLGAMDWEAFAIDGTPFLAVANAGSGPNATFILNSTIYRWSYILSSFERVQDVPTIGGNDWAAFTIDGVPFLAVANKRSDSSWTVNSVIYRWNGLRFVAVQDIPTVGAVDWEAFEINGIPFLAMASAGDAFNRKMNSALYRWNGTAFWQVQTVTSVGANDLAAFKIQGASFLAMANVRNDSSWEIQSTIYQLVDVCLP